MKPSRSLATPINAFRFVSLIPFDRTHSLGGKRVERWNTFHTFLAKGSGDVEDHCSLLCSLLLGFGLEAYVVMGTANDEPHTWVLTCVKRSASDFPKIEFWETLTGERRDADDPRSLKYYKNISCV